jgi:predicted enzyme related to lactoylglutathione lyase
MAEASPLGRVVWYEILTTDVNAAKAFYTAVVGWTTEAFAGAAQPYETWKRGDGVAVGGAMAIPDGMGFPPHWGMYVAVPSLDEAVARVESLGGSILSPVIDVPTVGRMRTMRDPQGAAFSLFEAATPNPQPETPPGLGDVAWHELMTTDAAAAMTFYTTLFGWRATDSMDMGEMGQYHMFSRTFPLGGMMNKPAALAAVPPNWGLYFTVPDARQSVDVVKAHGGQVLNGPTEVPGGDWIINCVDPQGAYFSLHSKKP